MKKYYIYYKNNSMIIKKYNKSKIINKLKEENQDDKGKNEEKEIKIYCLKKL